MEVVNSEYVEVDPTGRYGRYNEVLGKGASKIVYRAFDEYDGIEVAWNQVRMNDFLENTSDLQRLYDEIHLLKTLNHSNIMKFNISWVDSTQMNINFITEMFTSGTLRQYRQKHKRVNIRVIKDWCRQILKGLHYLHSLNPPVIHRDLKCDNIFINGNHGEVKIGDLGLAAILGKPHVSHCVGTPEFMAPEVYQEEYNQLVDIYSFGMCILEMVTLEYPYSECAHPVQIYKKVMEGKKPDALYKVKDPEVRRFVGKCLATVSVRLSARELLNDPFLQEDDCGGSLRSLEFPRRPLQRHPTFPCQNYGCYDHRYQNVGLYPPRGSCSQSIGIETDGMELFTYNEDRHPKNMVIKIKGKRKEDGEICLRLKIADKDGIIRNIYFPFDIVNDTALSVATEMVMELEMTDHDVTSIAEMIDGEIASLVPEWQMNQLVSDKIDCVIDKNVIVSSYGSKSYGNTADNSPELDPSPITVPTCAAEDDYENEIRQQLRWIADSYEKELKNLKNEPIRGHSRAPSWSPESNIEKHKTETPIPNSPVSTPFHGESDKLLLKSFLSGKHYSCCFAPIHNSCPESETQRDRHCEASSESISPEHMQTARSFYTPRVCPSSMHRSTSFLVHAVDV